MLQKPLGPSPITWADFDYTGHSKSASHPETDCRNWKFLSSDFTMFFYRA